MSRRAIATLLPTPEGERAPKRQKFAHLTLESFKNGVFLAPMVRSGARTPSHFPLQLEAYPYASQYQPV